MCPNLETEIDENNFSALKIKGIVVTLLKLSLCRTQFEQLLDTTNRLFFTSNSSDREIATNIEDVSNDKKSLIYQ